MIFSIIKYYPQAGRLFVPNWREAPCSMLVIYYLSECVRVCMCVCVVRRSGRMANFAGPNGLCRASTLHQSHSQHPRALHCIDALSSIMRRIGEQGNVWKNTWRSEPMRCTVEATLLKSQSVTGGGGHWKKSNHWLQEEVSKKIQLCSESGILYSSK